VRQNSRFWMSATTWTVIVRTRTERRFACALGSRRVTDKSISVGAHVIRLWR
jgi:hypothetical protein